MTGEQRTAFERLRSLAAPLRLRVVADVEGWPIIPGRLGQVEHHGNGVLAVYTDRPRLFARVWSIPGVRRHQTGDQEMRALFRQDVLPKVAQVIRARVRRSADASRHLAGHAYRATSGLQDAAGTAAEGAVARWGAR